MQQPPTDLAELAPSVTTLHVGKLFCREVAAGLLQLTSFTSNSKYDIDLSFLDRNKITHLAFLGTRNMIVDFGSFCVLTHLQLGDVFNTPTDNFLPSLKSLVVGNTFNQSLDHLPPLLEQLAIGQNEQQYDSFNQSVDHLPSSLSVLHIYASCFDVSLDQLPLIERTDCLFTLRVGF
jgi:hypothetical protein